MNRKEWSKMAEEKRAKWMADKGIDILADVFRIPFQVLEKLTKYEYQFVTSKFPTEVLSDDEPPKKLEEKTEIIPIDEYLGLYEPNKTRITIFNKGIKNASNIIKCNPEHLKYIVKLHEWSHALVHIGLREDDRLRALKEDSYWEGRLKQSTQVYESIETKLHEHIAQLLAYYSLNLLHDDAKHDEAKEVISRIIETFRELNKHQPREYVVDDYLEMPQGRVIESVSLLKKEWLKGVFDAWSTVMKW
jgi:hypothetical protein